MPGLKYPLGNASYDVLLLLFSDKRLIAKWMRGNFLQISGEILF